MDQLCRQPHMLFMKNILTGQMLSCMYRVTSHSVFRCAWLIHLFNNLYLTLVKSSVISPLGTFYAASCIKDWWNFNWHNNEPFFFLLYKLPRVISGIWLMPHSYGKPPCSCSLRFPWFFFKWNFPKAEPCHYLTKSHWLFTACHFIIWIYCLWVLFTKAHYSSIFIPPPSHTHTDIHSKFFSISFNHVFTLSDYQIYHQDIFLVRIIYS